MLSDLIALFHAFVQESPWNAGRASSGSFCCGLLAERTKWDFFQRVLVHRNPGGLNDTDPDGNAILHLAARAGKEAVCVKILSKEGFKGLLARDNMGYTAAMMADGPLRAEQGAAQAGRGG